MRHRDFYGVVAGGDGAFGKAVALCSEYYGELVFFHKSLVVNADGVVGKVAKVIEDIDNLAPSGTVQIDGKEWTARSKDGSVIKKDSLVTIDKIEGVKLIVKEGK